MGGGGLVWGRKERKQRLALQGAQGATEGAQLLSQEAPMVRVHAARRCVTPTEINWKPRSLGRMKGGHSQSQSTCSPCNRAWWNRSQGSQRLLCPGKATQLCFKSWFQSLCCTGPGERAKAMAPRSAGKPGQGVPIPEGTSFGKVTPLAMGRLQHTSRLAEIQGPMQKGETPW